MKKNIHDISIMATICRPIGNRKVFFSKLVIREGAIKHNDSINSPD